MNPLTSQPSSCRHQRGFFLIVVMLALVTIMLIYVMANLRILAALKRDIRIVEQKQVQRLEKLTPSALVVTNAPPTAPLTTAAP
jgi:type II secretory pathway component PulJ